MSSLSGRYDSFLFDLDGVLYRGTEPVAGADDAVRRLRDLGKGIAFVTNNSSRTPGQVAATLASIGIVARADEIVTSAVATASLLASRRARSAFVIGETGIRTALTDRGIDVVDGTPDAVDAVVVGWDRRADYEKLKTAALLVQRGARLFATNADASYPGPDGFWPGAGALLAVITTTTGASAEVVGKPHAPLFEAAAERAGGGKALFIGDRLDTDVAGAAGFGLDTLLVFTGVARPDDLVSAPALPSFVGADLTALFSGAVAVRPARPQDASTVAGLLRRAGLPMEEADDRPDSSLVAEWNGEVAGTLSLDLATTSAHLRSLAVEERLRGRAVGTVLLAHGLAAARRAGVTEVYVVTDTAEDFFVKLGFNRVGTLDAFPPAFRTRVTYCPETASVLRLPSRLP